jgi:hypothetical protein
MNDYQRLLDTLNNLGMLQCSFEVHIFEKWENFIKKYAPQDIERTDLCGFRIQKWETSFFISN